MKKKMIRVALFTALITSGFGLSLFAQQAQPAQQDQAQKGKMTPEQRADMRVNRMKQNLNLTDEQASKIKALIVQQQNEHKTDSASLQGERKHIMDELAKILTADQMTKYKQQMHSNQREPVLAARMKDHDQRARDRDISQ